MKIRFLIFATLLLKGLGLNAQHNLSGCDKGSLQNVVGSCWNYPYMLVYEEEFNGNSLNLNDWGTKYPQGSPYMDANVDVQEWNTLDNVSVSNGYAFITAKYDPAMRLQVQSNSNIGTDGGPNLRNYNYTSASVWSNYIFGNGYFEMMCTVPYQAGYWPAFWLYNEYNNVNTELDIFEMWDDNSNDVNLTIHNGQACGHAHHSDYSFATGLHKFAAYWDDWKIVWLIDDVVVQYTYKWYIPGSFPPYGISCEDAETVESFPAKINSSFPETPMQMIFNLAVRKTCSNTTPVVMQIDYIRFYQQRANCYTAKTYTNRLSLDLDDDLVIAELHKPYYHHKTAKTIDLIGDITVLTGEQLKLTAAESLNFDLDPVSGLPIPNSSIVLDIQPGANFEAIIDPNVCSNFINLPPIEDVTRKAPDQIMEELANQDEYSELGLSQDLFKPERVSISPNPSNQDVVTITSSERTKVIITNSMGIKVKEIEVQNGLNKLNIQDLSSGVYHLYFETLKETVKLVRL